MSETFIGIENSNEFFTQHYLAAILSGDLKPLLSKWRDAAAVEKQAAEDAGDDRKVVRMPPQALSNEHLIYFPYRERMGRQKAVLARVEGHLGMARSVLQALGYTPRLTAASLPGGHVPLLATVDKPDGAPLLWCIPVVGTLDEDRPTLGRPILAEQLEAIDSDLGAKELVAPSAGATVEELATEAFNLDEPPRFILVFGESELFLLERAKWSEQRLLSFDLEEILGRREDATLDVTAAILHRDCLVPDDGTALVDSLNDNSHKHAFGVSEDLKYALQGCIERLGNAAILHKRKVSKEKVFGTDVAEQVSRECLRYMYRMLFLFYIEARPELGYAPMGSDAYRLGYSLERLRELEQLDLQTEEAKNGTYIHESLQLLFEMLYDGRKPKGQEVRLGHRRTTDKLDLGADDESATSLFRTFELQPLRTHLFDPARTPFLNGVKFSNEVLRQVIEDMSLTRPSSKKSKRRGRISYATLGINQLGAVYEALLSFRGFFAETDIYEVKPSNQKNHDVLKTAYFVPEGELGTYDEKERVYEDDGTTLKRYPRGTFIYRLAGRDRQTSASYYTPEVLTRCLVKYALKELLEDEKGRPTKTADEILELTVCEPAMGSAAFLNEAVDQLAEAYLRAKQKELGTRIKHERYGFEKQRVKMYLADNNVFGVDLNPIAVELAEVSLWLNTIHEGGFVPWFGGQTVCGNSLIGARRQVFKKGLVAGKGGTTGWLGEVPERVPLGGKVRPKGSVYHFLLGDLGMSVYGEGTEGKPIREMASEALDVIDDWRSAFCAPVDKDDAMALSELSDAIDRLWMHHVELLRSIRERTTDPLEVYGKPLPPGTRGPTTTAEKDEIWQGEMESKHVRAASPYRRLKLVMDYWCALWFWPIEKADLMPDRDEFLADLALLLDSDVLTTLQGGTQTDLFAPTMAADKAQALAKELGIVDVDKLLVRNERLRLVDTLATEQRFLHWELEYADLFYDRGGFDLMVGNPPWVRVQWSEADVLSDDDPSFALKGLSASETSKRREEALSTSDRQHRYYLGHEKAAGTQGFLSANQNYSELNGVKPNLYKCFLPTTWQWLGADGVVGLLHPEGVYDDPKGGGLRDVLYPRLRKHYQFINEVNLFAEVDHHMKFSVNIYASPKRAPSFTHLANLFTPETIELCEEHDGHGPVPGIKEEGSWATGGHRERLIKVGKKELELFAKLYDPSGTPASQARLPAVHSQQLVGVLEQFEKAEHRLSDIADHYPHDMWNETRAQRNGTIARVDPAQFSSEPSGVVLSGPHFYVGNPYYKTPRKVCTNNSHYDVLDLTELPEDYVQRTNYVPACSNAEYLERSPKVPWVEGAHITDFYRIVVNRAVGPASERTIQPAVGTPGAAHIDGVYSYTFRNESDLLMTVSSWGALPIDFFVKTTGVSDFRPNVARQLPIASKHSSELAVRMLLLSCLTSHYINLWGANFRQEFPQERWSKSDERLSPGCFTGISPKWTYATPLRDHYSRRQALVEIDVLVSIGLGLSLKQLQTMYRSQFYVMRGYESDTWYDRCGRIVFTNSKGLVGVGLKRSQTKGDPNPCWNDVKNMKSGTVERTFIDATHPGEPRERTIVYEAPFDRCDREEDYAVAWKHFSERFGDKT